MKTSLIVSSLRSHVCKPSRALHQRAVPAAAVQARYVATNKRTMMSSRFACKPSRALLHGQHIPAVVQVRNFATNKRTMMSSSDVKNEQTKTEKQLSPRARSYPTKNAELEELIGKPLQKPAGHLYGSSIVDDEAEEILVGDGVKVKPAKSTFFIPQIALHAEDGRERKRVLVLCTGGTLTMAPDPNRGGALAPVEGALIEYMKEMGELLNENMPEVVCHEYTPFMDSSDLGPADWAVVANDIKANYLHFDGFVVCTGTDTMAYFSTALSFMLENLGKPVVFTGSQIPLSEPYNDARRNLIMALIFAARETCNEVSIFFHDRLIRACRATKVNTHKLLAFDSPNLDPLATIGITIDENESLHLPPPRGALRVHTTMDTRLLTLRLVPGFDDGMIRHMIEAQSSAKKLRGLVLQLYGTGNVPSVKESFITLLADAADKGIMVVATTQCYSGGVVLGHYATGHALQSAGVVSAGDMTLEAAACKVAYLLGRGDLSMKEASNLMSIPLRGEVTPLEDLPPPPLASAYERAARKGKVFY